LTERGLLDNGLKVRMMTLPDEFLDHAKPDQQMARAGLDAQGIVRKAMACLQRRPGSALYVVGE